MHALVSTPSFLLLVDLDGGRVTPIECERPEYYGISWFPGAADLVLSHSGIDNASLVDLRAYASSEAGWISTGEAPTEPFLSQPHQILCASDGRIICTNTGRNCITIIDPSRPGHFQETRLSPARWDRLSPAEATGDHVNSVFERAGRLHVLTHGLGRESSLATFSYPGMEPLGRRAVAGRSGLHNIWVTPEGQLICCGSEAGALIDITGGEVLWEAGAPVYTRGIAAGGGVVVVGESQKAGRNDRRTSMSGLWILDPRSWDALGYLSLGPFGAVHEVRLLDVPDDAHHGHVFAGFARLASGGLGAGLAARRLALAAAAGAARRCWSGYEQVFGSPDADDEGVRIASPHELCLAVLAGTAGQDEVAFDYGLTGEGPHAHVSAVVGYRGSGTDTAMTALLVQRAGAEAVGSVWRHDGTDWACLPGTARGDLPLHGRARLLATPDGFALSVDGVIALSVPAAEAGASGGSRGIRWIGARVRPVAAG